MNNFSNSHRKEMRISGILGDLPVGIISFTADGLVDFINPAFIKMGILYHLKLSTLSGTNIFDKEIIPGISLTEEMNEVKNGYPFEKEIKNLKTANGSELSLIIKCSPNYEDDRFAGGIIVLEDLQVLSESREEDSYKIKSFNKIANEIAELFFIVDIQGKIKYSSGSKLLSISSDDPKNLILFELIPDLPENFKDILSETKTRQEAKKIITKLLISKEPAYYECLISPLSGKQPAKYLSCTFINISDKIRSENLEDRLKLFEIVADVNSDGIIGTNSKGVINLWTQSVLSLTGFPDEETIGKPVWNYIPELKEKNFSRLKEDLQQVNFFKKQIFILDNSGSEAEVDASFLLGDEDNIFISLNASSKKIRDLKTKEDNFRSLVEETDVIVIKLNNAGVIEYINPAFTSQLNYYQEEVIGKNINDFLPPENKLEFNGQDKPFYREIIFQNKYGEKFYFTAGITPAFRDNALQSFNVCLINQTGKKKEERDLNLFKLLFENTNEGIAVESNGKIVAANNTFAKIFGYSFGNEITGKDILDLTATNDVLKVAEYLQMFHARKDLTQRWEFTGKRKNGSNFFCELTPSSFQVEGSWRLAIIIRDITERKRAQQIIRESEEKYRNLIENIDDFLFTLERSKLFFKPAFFTSSVEKITGYTQAEMLLDIKLLLKIVHPDDAQSVKENLKKFSRSRSKTSAEIELRIISKQGNVVWIRNKLSVIRNEKGEVEKVYGLVSNISLRKKTEESLQRTTQNLVKLNETKDRFISIISHDLRTPFSSILGFTDLLLNDETLTSEERNQYVKYIQESSNAMLSLVNSLLDWTRLQTGRIRFEPEKVEASEIISKSINALGGAAFQKDISISSNVQENLFLYIDKDLIGQVFNNLISNAIKFTKAGGSITISSSPSQFTRFIEFSVKDTGVGIKPEDVKKLFGVDTKFTTEGTAGEKGTGLGLSLVKEIIERHGGNIHIESEIGTGTNFLFTLPVAAANILLIDSNTTERILYSKILKHITSDYNIDTASNGSDALNKLSASTYALIVTEHNMPVLGGYDLVLELKKLDMKVKPPVIVLSNSVDRQTIDDYNEIGVEYVFQKPVNLSLFKQAVEKSLHQGLK